MIAMSWHHGPRHSTDGSGIYFITSATLHKQHIYRGHKRLDLLASALLEHVSKARWRLDAWAAFSNHYHVVVGIPADAGRVPDVIRALHSELAIAANELDDQPGRQVWHQYRDTELVGQRSELARTAYVYHNPVKHGIVAAPEQYRWCSAGWGVPMSGRFGERTLRSFVPSRIHVDDDFDVVVG